MDWKVGAWFLGTKPLYVKIAVVMHAALNKAMLQYPGSLLRFEIWYDVHVLPYCGAYLRPTWSAGKPSIMQRASHDFSET